MSAPREYVLCTLPRTGSNLLKSGLAHTGLAGTPEEVLGDEAIEWRGFDSAALQLGAYFAHVRSELTGPNGVFGVKLHQHQAEKHLFSRGFDLDDVLKTPRVIVLERRDLVAQTASWVRAKQSGVYHFGQPATDSSTPTYDFIAMCLTAIDIVVQRAAWKTHLARNRERPLELSYEELTADYESSIRRVIAFIGAAEGAPMQIDRPRLRKQRDDLSELWRARFASDLRLAKAGTLEVHPAEFRDTVYRVARRAAALLECHRPEALALPSEPVSTSA